jgi:hypothetical protein
MAAGEKAQAVVVETFRRAVVNIKKSIVDYLERDKKVRAARRGAATGACAPRRRESARADGARCSSRRRPRRRPQRATASA